jgi:hypothetical protein
VVEALSGGRRLIADCRDAPCKRRTDLRAKNVSKLKAQPAIYALLSDEMENKNDHEPILSGAYLSTEGI